MNDYDMLYFSELKDQDFFKVIQTNSAIKKYGTFYEGKKGGFLSWDASTAKMTKFMANVNKEMDVNYIPPKFVSSAFKGEYVAMGAIIKPFRQESSVMKTPQISLGVPDYPKDTKPVMYRGNPYLPIGRTWNQADWIMEMGTLVNNANSYVIFMSAYPENKKYPSVIIYKNVTLDPVPEPNSCKGISIKPFDHKYIAETSNCIKTYQNFTDFLKDIVEM